MEKSDVADTRCRQVRMWVVRRQDDNGNRYVVAAHLSEAEAERMAAEYESRGHKQVYWAEPECE